MKKEPGLLVKLFPSETSLNFYQPTSRGAPIVCGHFIDYEYEFIVLVQFLFHFVTTFSFMLLQFISFRNFDCWKMFIYSTYIQLKSMLVI